MKCLRVAMIGLLLSWVFYAPLPAMAECKVLTDDPTYTDGQLKDLRCTTAGLLDVNISSGAVSSLGTANAAAPSLSEGAAATFSFDLSGNARMTLGTLLSGEDQSNNLLMTSGGAVRITTILGSSGVVAAVGADPFTSTATILPVGKKTFQALLTCTGTCTQTQKIYGASESSATVAKSVLVCQLTPSATTTATDYCVTDKNFSYWFVVASGYVGTSLLNGLFVQY